MKTNTNTLFVAIGIIALAIVAFLVTNRPQIAQGSSFPMAPALTVATTSTSVAVTSSTRILASTTNPLATPGVGSFQRA